MRQLLALLLITAALAGCGGLGKTPAAPDPQPIPPVTDDIIIGGPPKYIDAATCPAEAQQVIAKQGIGQVVRCAATPMKTDAGEKVHYVLISHGPGMDCPSGCIFEATAALVFADAIALLPEPFPDDTWLVYELNQRLGTALPDQLSEYTRRQLRQEHKGPAWEMVLTFTAHLEGTVTVPAGYDPRRLQIEARPRAGTMTREQVRSLVWDEVQAQCKPPAGTTLMEAEAAPLGDGTWQGTVVYGLGDKYTKARFQVAQGKVTFPEGCNVDRLK